MGDFASTISPRTRLAIAVLGAVAVALVVAAITPELVLALGMSGTIPVYSANIHEREVALTLDDGPSPQYTPEILAVLRTYHAHATFFVMGAAAQANPGLVKQEIADGNEVGVHAFDRHVRFTTISKTAAGKQIDGGKDAVVDVTGDRPALFRPPYGVWRPWVLAEAAKRDLRTILWSVCFDHRSTKTPKAVASRVLSLAKPGEILLLHDARGDRRKAVGALPLVLRGLEARGYKVVTVSQLLANAAAGK